MAVTYGFYNSSNGDRKYNALQFSRLFEGIIRDGVFSTVGGSLMVVAASNLTVNISSGRAWFNNTWTNNDALLPLTLDPAEAILNRYDAIVLEVAPNERENRFKIVKGTPATTPIKPVMVKAGGIYQYPLAYIYVGKGVGSVSQANISNAVGTTECPFITGAMQQVTTNAIVAQWESEFNTWFDDLQAQLEGNVVTNLQNQINTKLTADGGDGKDVVVSFTEAATEAHISSGEKLSVLFGKILKMFKGKAPNSHASSATTYGVGTTANYGHVKTINNLTQANHVNGTALSAYQGKLLDDKVNLKALKPVLIRSVSMPSTLQGFGVQITDNLDSYDEIILELTGTCTLQNTGTSATAIGSFGFGKSTSDADMPVTTIYLGKSKSVSVTIQGIRRYRLVLGVIDGSAVLRSMADGTIGSSGQAFKYTDLYLLWDVSGTNATLNITSGSLTAKIYGLKVVRL